MFYGCEQENVSFCDSSGFLDGVCVLLDDIVGYNRVQVYERCQMKFNCIIVVFNDMFCDLCFGFSKYLKINYMCSFSKKIILYFCINFFYKWQYLIWM